MGIFSPRPSPKVTPTPTPTCTPSPRTPLFESSEEEPRPSGRPTREKAEEKTAPAPVRPQPRNADHSSLIVGGAVRRSLIEGAGTTFTCLFCKAKGVSKVFHERRKLDQHKHFC